MNDFNYQGNQLFCEKVPLMEVVREVGTPLYLYSHGALLRHFSAYQTAFKNIPHIIAYAVKANGSLAVLRLFGSQGSGADIVSGGELHRALSAGIPAEKIVFAGVGKTVEEIRFALSQDILMFNVESSQELRVINQVAGDMGLRARVALRVNPDVDPKTHPYISTGLKENKFGIGIQEALKEYKTAESLSHVELVGIHQHIGSQLTQVSPYVDALDRLMKLVAQLKDQGISIAYINIGGGLGITYENEVPPQPMDLAKAIGPYFQDHGIKLILEPGRSLVGNAGILITKILYLKGIESKRFVILDAGMNDLIRPSLYGAYHQILPVEKQSRGTVVADLVGPICESGDFLAKEREIEDCRPGEFLAIMSAGAYGFAMASNYNARPRPAEVMVKGNRFSIIREREEYQDLHRGERLPDFL